MTGAKHLQRRTTLNGGTLSVSGNSALRLGTVSMAGGTDDLTFADANPPECHHPERRDQHLYGGGWSDGCWAQHHRFVQQLGVESHNKITLAGTNSLTSSGAFNIGAGSVDITGSDNNRWWSALRILGLRPLATMPPRRSPSAMEGRSRSMARQRHEAEHHRRAASYANQHDQCRRDRQEQQWHLGDRGNTGFVLGNNSATATGVLTISSGTATITAGSATLQNVQNFIAMGRDNATGIINLDGGTLATGRQFVRDGSAAARRGAGTATFNFNGGVLKAQADQTQGNGWFETATTGNFQVVTTNVAEGGAKIDTNGFTVNINTVLAHAGGNAIDGGLVKSGAGTLSLGGTNTFTGNAIVNEGKLSLATNVSLDDTITLSLAANTALELAFASGSEVVAGLILNGTAVADGTYTVAELNILGAAASINFTGTDGTLTVGAVPSRARWRCFAWGWLAACLFSAAA